MTPREEARRGRKSPATSFELVPKGETPPDLEELRRKIEALEQQINSREKSSRNPFPNPAEYPVRYSQAAGLILNAVWIMAYGEELDPGTTAAIAAVVQSLLAVFAGTYLDSRKEK